MPAPGAPSRIGELLAGKYRLEKLLGTGGMGQVYRAENTLIGRTVAIKTLRVEFASSHEVVTRFMREAKAANLVRHPNVVDVLDIGQDDHGSPFIVQEFLHGTDLARHLEDLGGRLPPDAVLKLMMPVIDAIALAHSKGVVHRDLKPENVFLAREGNTFVPKVLDFGISKIASTPNELRMTSADAAMGTPAYMSPEQVRGARNVDARTDVWALGVMLHELLAGDLPFTGETQGAIFLQICTKEPATLIEVAPHVSPAVAAIVERCLRKDTTTRYANATELVRDLRAALDASNLARASGSQPDTGVGSSPSSPRLIQPFNESSHAAIEPSRSPAPPPVDLLEGFLDGRTTLASLVDDLDPAPRASLPTAPVPTTSSSIARPLRATSRSDLPTSNSVPDARLRTDAEPSGDGPSAPHGFTDSASTRRNATQSFNAPASGSMYPSPSMRMTPAPLAPASGGEKAALSRVVVSLGIAIVLAAVALQSQGWSVLAWSQSTFVQRPVEMLGVSAFLTLIVAVAFVVQGFRRTSPSIGLVAAGGGSLALTGYLAWAVSAGGWPVITGAVSGPLVVLPWLLALVPAGLAIHALAVVAERSADGRAEASPWPSTGLTGLALVGVFCVVQILHGLALPVTAPAVTPPPADTPFDSTPGDDGLIHRSHATGH